MATQPITESIIDNIIATLKGVTTGNSYNQTIYQVSRFTTETQIKFAKFPAADVVIDNIDKSDEQDHDWQICNLSAMIGVYVENRNDPGQALSFLVADIEKALAVDVTRGTYALDTAITSIDFDYVDSNPTGITGVATMSLTIEYQHRRADPYAQV